MTRHDDGRVSIDPSLGLSPTDPLVNLQCPQLPTLTLVFPHPLKKSSTAIVRDCTGPSIVFSAHPYNNATPNQATPPRTTPTALTTMLSRPRDDLGEAADRLKRFMVLVDRLRVVTI
jgi:hypothetical protein